MREPRSISNCPRRGLKSGTRRFTTTLPQSFEGNWNGHKHEFEHHLDQILDQRSAQHEFMSCAMEPIISIIQSSRQTFFSLYHSTHHVVYQYTRPRTLVAVKRFHFGVTIEV